MGQYLLKLFEKVVGVYYLNYRVYSVSQSINQSTALISVEKNITENTL